MAISDELNRIIQAKADIRSALGEKGLVIGESSTLDEYPALIQTMQTGGGTIQGYDVSKVIDYIERDITSIVIPATTTKIGDYAFSGCNYLTDVSIPSSVTQITASAFQYCQTLHNLTLPNSLTSIGNGAFFQAGLYTVVIPASVTNIGNNAFKNMASMTNIALLQTTPPTLGNTGLDGNWPIYVKNAYVDAYKNAGGNWNDVSTRITPLASMSYDKTTYTVTALGRNNLELYIDSNLCNSPVYTFDPSTESGQHTIQVKSMDGNLGLLDSSTAQINVEEYQYGMPYLFKVSFNNGDQDVTVRKSDTTDQNSKITMDEWTNAAYNGTYNATNSSIISQLWIGDECEYIGDPDNSTDYNATSSGVNNQFMKGTNANRIAFNKVIISPNVKKIVGNQVFMYSRLAGKPFALIFLGECPELPYGLKLSGQFSVSNTGTTEDPSYSNTNDTYVYVQDEYVNDYISNASFLTQTYGTTATDATLKRQAIIKGLSEYDDELFGQLLDKMPSAEPDPEE